MLLDAASGRHLTYCTNIHPADGWEQVRAALEEHAPALRDRVRPAGPFGIGLRLSGRESREVLERDRLEELAALLDRHGLYVFTMNGFPHGAFHRTRVKEDVHAPDWRSQERVDYTLRLAAILARLLPEGLHGGISTSPLTYRGWVDERDDATWRHVTGNVVRVAEALARREAETGTLIHVDLEPEPDGLLQDTDDVVAFFRDRLLPQGGRELAARLHVSREAAEALVLRHVRICLDTCHVALVYDDPAAMLDRLAECGIHVGKVQISSALAVALPDAEAVGALEAFAESTYLHQVIERDEDGIRRRFPDLRPALEAGGDGAQEWRVHFHVPVFLQGYGRFASTQPTIRAVLDLLRERGFCQHLEIETYTWEVLPQDLRLPLVDSIAREYAFVLEVA